MSLAPRESLCSKFMIHRGCPQRTPNLLTPSPWTSSLQSTEEVNFCCFIHWVCGIAMAARQADTAVFPIVTPSSRSQESEELTDHISPLWLTTEEHVASLRHPFRWLHIPRAEAPRQCSPASVPQKHTLASSTKEMPSCLPFRDWH